MGMCSEWHYTTREIGGWRCLHTPIPELCNAILNICQMPSCFYIIPSIVNKSQTHLLKPFIARDLMEGHTCMQAKHADVCSGVLFWNAGMRHTHVLSLPSHCEKSDKWRQAGSVKLPKSHERYHNVAMWHWIVYKWRRSKCWVFIAHFSIYSTSRCHCHAGTDILRLCGHTLQINQVVRTVRHRISCCTPTIHWKCDARMQNWQIKFPPALWKHFSFEYLGVIVVVNGEALACF